MLIAEDGGPVGYARADFGDTATVSVIDLYVRPGARRQGVAKALLADVVAAAKERGLTHLLLEFDARNHEARASSTGGSASRRDAKIFRVGASPRSSRGSSRARPARASAPCTCRPTTRRMSSASSRASCRASARHGGATVTAAPNGWTRVTLDPFDRDVHQKLAQELSYRFGAIVVALAVEDGAVVHFLLYDRNRMVDEYLSVPEYYEDAAARRRARAAREPDGRLAAHRRRPRARSRDRAHRGDGRRAAAAARAVRADRGADGAAGVITLYDAARCPVLCARPDRARGEGHPARARGDRPREPAELDLREERDRPRARARGGHVRAARVAPDHGVPRGALPRAGACCPPIPRSARSSGCASTASTRSSATTTTRSAAATRTSWTSACRSST